MSAENGAVRPARVLGFDVRLSGASLWDLVQMECQARVRRVFQVKGEGGVGYLYLAAGRIVHAAAGRLVGQTAALEILGWSNGSFQPCERPWPQAATIDTTHEALILEVARRRDEANASKLLAFPSRGAAAATTDPTVEDALDEIESMEIAEVNDPYEPHEPGAKAAPPPQPRTGGAARPSGARGLEGGGQVPSAELPSQGPAQTQENDMRSTTFEQPPTPNASAGAARAVEMASDFPVMLRLSGSGAIVRNHGGSEEQGEAIAYAQRLVQLAGELLGLDAFSAMEAVFASSAGGGRWFLFAESGGDTVALRPRPEANLVPLRERLGL